MWHLTIKKLLVPAADSNMLPNLFHFTKIKLEFRVLLDRCTEIETTQRKQHNLEPRIEWWIEKSFFYVENLYFRIQAEIENKLNFQHFNKKKKANSTVPLIEWNEVSNVRFSKLKKLPDFMWVKRMFVCFF